MTDKEIRQFKRFLKDEGIWCVFIHYFNQAKKWRNIYFCDRSDNIKEYLMSVSAIFVFDYAFFWREYGGYDFWVGYKSLWLHRLRNK